MSDVNEEIVEEMPKKRSRKRKAPATAKPIDSRDMAIAAARLADEKLGSDINLLDVEELTSYTSYILLVSVNSSRQAMALGGYLEDLFLNQFATKPLSREGIEGTTWMLLDFGDIIIHVFTEEERDRYDLDGFWKDAKRVDFSAKK